MEPGLPQAKKRRAGRAGSIQGESVSGQLSCFKAYDVRGKVPAALNTEIAYAVGRAFAEHFAVKKVVLGHDARLSGPALQNALMAGLEKAGAEVYDIGLCTTEEIYYASAWQPQSVLPAEDGNSAFFDGGIMVTGSHNPADENGLKFVRGGAVPVSGDTGLFEVRDLAFKHLQEASGHPEAPEHARHFEVRSSYLDYLARMVPLAGCRKLKVHIDPGNGCGGLLAKPLCERIGLECSSANMEPDGHFPNGVPNPLLPEKREATSRAVREQGADFGVAWDGDADRCFFYDEDGSFIEGYYIVGLIAQAVLAEYPGAKIIHDPRLYWNTVDLVRSAGGIPVQSKTGHAFIKERMRAENAVYGGEMSAHHYFKDFAYCDNGSLPWLLMLSLLSKSSKTLCELVQERSRLFPCSGEINSRVEDAAGVMKAIEQRYAPQASLIEHVDGLSMEFAGWRFNLRSSNTEPLLRLNVESRGDRALMEDRTQEILRLVRS